MKEIDLNFAVSRLGECQITSPITGVRFVNDEEHVLYHSDLGAIKSYLDAGKEPPCLEKAGPGRKSTSTLQILSAVSLPVEAYVRG